MNDLSFPIERWSVVYMGDSTLQVPVIHITPNQSLLDFVKKK